MKHARSALTVVLSFAACLLTAQSISPSVISSAGGLGVSAGGTLSYTVGEMAMIETFASPGHFLTQGFQQPWELITSTKDDFTSIGLQLYPNPTNDEFYLHIDAVEAKQLQLRMTDMIGQVVYREPLHVTGASTITSIHAGHLASGVYLLTVSSLQADSHPIHPVTTKIHIAH